MQTDKTDGEPQLSAVDNETNTGMKTEQQIREAMARLESAFGLIDEIHKISDDQGWAQRRFWASQANWAQAKYSALDWVLGSPGDVMDQIRVPTKGEIEETKVDAEKCNRDALEDEELLPRVHIDGSSCQSDFPAGYGFSPQYESLDVLVLIGQEQVNKPRVVIAGVLDGPYDELPGSDIHTHPDDVAIRHGEALRPKTKLVHRPGEFKTKGAFDRVFIREGADEDKSRELAELLIAKL